MILDKGDARLPAKRRVLLYVPIIHGEADLGSLASPVGRESSRSLGEEVWRRHLETVSRFWEAIADYFENRAIPNLKVYQDGLMADGEMGRRIIEEGAKRGSRNHQIVLELLRKGAEIRKTEDPRLLEDEYTLLKRMISAKSPVERLSLTLKYKFQKGRLLENRDRFIAKQINETLKTDETGLLFLGAYHSVGALLSPDICVKEVKEERKVKDYFDLLVQGGHPQRLKELAEYLVSRVPTDPPDPQGV